MLKTEKEVIAGLKKANNTQHVVKLEWNDDILREKKMKRIPAESKPKAGKTLNENYPLIHISKHFINGTIQHRVDCDKSRKSMWLRNWLLEFIKTNVTDVNHS